MYLSFIVETYVYVYSDWVGDINTRKFITGLTLMLAGRSIGYKSKSKVTIAHSTTEAEFTGAQNVLKAALFSRSRLNDIGLTSENCTIIYEDNAAATEMASAQNPIRQGYDVKHFALLEWCKNDEIILFSISTSDNAADYLTKTTVCYSILQT